MRAALDEAWFDRFLASYRKIGETYELLLPTVDTLAKKRTAFENSNYAKNISLYPNRADISLLQSAYEELARLKDDISEQEYNVTVKNAYLDFITSTQWNARMISAATSKNDTLFRQANKALYSDPDVNVFQALCHWIRKDTENTLRDTTTSIGTLGHAVLEIIPDYTDNHHMLIPKEDVFHRVRQAHLRKKGYYDMLFGQEGLPSEPYIDEGLGTEICQQLLHNIDSDFSLVASENNIWATFPSRKELVHPSGYRLDRDEFIGIVCHEIGSHLLEYRNGSTQKMKLLSIGLAGYERGHEGRAFLREQIVYENERTFLKQFAWEYIVLLHLSVSLSSGLHGRPYTFSELYKVLYTLYLFWRERRLPRSTNNEAFAREEAWQLAVRVMKGTDGRGGSYMKDTIYLEGNIDTWKAAESNQEIIFIGDQGKIDITNPTHMKILRELQIS